MRVLGSYSVKDFTPPAANIGAANDDGALLKAVVTRRV